MHSTYKISLYDNALYIQETIHDSRHCMLVSQPCKYEKTDRYYDYAIFKVIGRMII